MIATEQFILESFSSFNHLCFEGVLPPIPVKLTKARTFLGKITYVGRRNFFGRIVGYEKYVMRISTYYNLCENELEDVIIHEMIHYYIALNGLKDSSAHGKIFRKMMSDINARFGRHITVSRRSKDLNLSAD